MTRKPPPLRKTDFSHITVCDAVRTALASDYHRLGTWAAVGAERGVSAGMAQRVATSSYEPKSAKARAALGLPVLVLAPVCACGEVHLRVGRCPNAPKRPRQPGPTPNQRRAVRLLGVLWGTRWAEGETL